MRPPKGTLMQRLANFDVTRQFRTVRSQRIAQYVFGVVCAAVAISLRSVVDIGFPTSGPFALIYPTVLLATLYGHFRAGLTSLVLSFMWAWYFVLPAPASLDFVDPADPARVAINALCCLIVIVFAEAFRRAAQSRLQEIRRSADRRLTLLAELEHRTKNNFTLVASMLEIQKRRLPDDTLHGPLDDAVGRVRTFAAAYSNLAFEQAEQNDVAMGDYLQLLLDRLEKAAVPANIQLYREVQNAVLTREIAVAISLYLNEALSNSLKYASPRERSGTIGVYFHIRDGHWQLTVEDDGVGNDALQDQTGGLGSSLMNAFAQQAGAAHDARAFDHGFRATLTCKADETVAA